MGQVSMQHESVSQIGKQLWLKLRNKLSLNPVSIRILEVQKTRSRISKPTLMILMIDVSEIFAMVSLISCQQKSHCCYRARLHEVNTNRFEISLRDQISLRCEVTSLSRFTWLRAEWNSFRCKFHFGQIDWIPVSNCSHFSM